MIAGAGNLLLSGKYTSHLSLNLRQLLTLSRGINEGRQCAREVDSFLMGISSHLPVTGGIIRRPAIDAVPQPVHSQAVSA